MCESGSHYTVICCMAYWKKPNSYVVRTHSSRSGSGLHHVAHLGYDFEVIFPCLILFFQHVFGRDEQKSCRQYRYVCYESLCHTVSSTIRRKLGNCWAIHVFRGVLGRVQKPECLPQQVLGAERFAQSMPAVPVLPILLGLLQNRVLVKVLSCAENEGWSFCHGIITHYTQ